MNRYKKEQMKKKKEDPNYNEPEGRSPTQEEWDELMHWYEDHTWYERMAKTFPGPQRWLDRRAEELSREADEERESRMRERKEVEGYLKQSECAKCSIKASEMRGKRVISGEHKGWICQKCADRVCDFCGAPLVSVPGLDYIDQKQMRILHSPILPIKYVCIDNCQKLD